MLLALALGLLGAAPAPALAAVEDGDAGDLPATAQAVPDDADLSSIQGSLGVSGDRDLYRVCLRGGDFSATTVGGTQLDTQLWLFDAQGLGVAGNDDSPNQRASTLPLGNPLLPSTPGEYLLGISGYNQDPLSAAGNIFDDVSLSVLAPNGPGAGQPLSGWSGRAGLAGDYAIALTGVVPCAVPDQTAPTVDLDAPVDGASYAKGETVTASYRCADERGGSGVATCDGDVPDGAPIDTSTAGEHSFSVRAVDEAGNEAVVSVTYTVTFSIDFEGFFGLEAPPAVNEVRAGDDVVLAFRLGGLRWHEAVADGYPVSAEVACGEDVPPGAGEPVDLDPWDWHRRSWRRSGLHVVVWDTEREWAGSCRQLVLQLTDGSVHRLNVEFERRGWHRGDWDRHHRHRDRHRRWD